MKAAPKNTLLGGKSGEFLENSAEVQLICWKRRGVLSLSWICGRQPYPPPQHHLRQLQGDPPVASSLQAVEAAQLAEDLKVQLEHTQSKLKEIQVSVAENRTARERESSNLKRAQVRRCCTWELLFLFLLTAGLVLTAASSRVFQEDLSRLRRKLEKQKKVEMYTDADEILQEEINQYKVREEEASRGFTHTSFHGKG